jgi:hypothetical protein
MPPIPRSRAHAQFEKLGVADPAAWAAREADLPALSRWLLLTGLWRCVHADDAGAWIEARSADEDDPIAAAIGRLLECGIDPADLTAVVRDMQIAALDSACRLLDDGEHGIEELREAITEVVEWQLAELDSDSADLGRPIEELHLEFRDFDPTGRRGEARKPPRRARGTRSPP